MAASAPDADKRMRCRGCRAKLRLPAGVDPRGLSCPRCGTRVVPDTTRRNGEPAGTQIDDIDGYRVMRRIARGGMGVVYECAGRDGRGRYAVKVMSPGARANPECVRRFQREGRIGGLIDHPAVVRTHACEETADGRLYMVMELIEGLDLARMVRAEGALPWRRALAYTQQVAGALATMTELGIVHRDIKPQNIMVGRDGRAKLADFGLVKHLDGEDDMVDLDGALTVTGTQMGTPAYMSPEQVDDSARVGPQCDVYALAATLYQLLTGRRPFDGKGAVAVMEQVLYEEPPRPRSIVPTIPPALDELIVWCMDKNERLRPPDGIALEGLLELVRRRPDDVQAVRDARGTLAHRGMGQLLMFAVLILVPVLAAVCYVLITW